MERENGGGENTGNWWNRYGLSVCSERLVQFDKHEHFVVSREVMNASCRIVCLALRCRADVREGKGRMRPEFVLTKLSKDRWE